jgi:tetratricopeptide (TPR) repeat protein
MLKLLQNLLAGQSDKESASKTTAIQTVSPDSVESQIIQADNLWQQGKLVEAITVYSHAIKHNPESSEIYEHLSGLLKQQGNIAEAYEKLATDLKGQGNIELAASYYRQAIGIKALAGDTKQKLLKPNLVKWQKKNTAIAELKEDAFSFQPLSHSSLITKERRLKGEDSIYFARQVKNIDAAKAISIDWETAQVYLQQALDCCEQKQWESASQACQQAIAIVPDMAEAYKIWGNALQRMGKTAEAMDCYAKAVKIKPDLAEVYAGIGDVYSNQQKWQQAIEYYQKAIIINPNPQIYRSAAYVWRQLGQLEQSELNISKALELESTQDFQSENSLDANQVAQTTDSKSSKSKLSNDSVTTYHQIAKKLERQNRWQEAAICYRKALEISIAQPALPAQTGGEIELASLPKTLANQKKFTPNNTHSDQQSIIEDLNLLNSKVKQNFQPTESRETQIDKAIRRYYKQVELEPNSASIHSNLGNLYARKRQWDLAIACYERAIQIDPQYAPARLNLARSFAKIGKQEEFIQEMKRALKLQPDIASAIDRYYLGNALLQQGKEDEAISSYYKAIVMNPYFVQVYHRLGEVLSQQGKHEDAIEFYQQAISHNPDDAELYYSLGQQFAIQQNWNAAVKAYTKVLQLNPRFPNAPKQLNYALAEKLKLDLANKGK